MMISDGFFFKTLDMNKLSFFIIIGIALAAHATGPVFMKRIKIMTDDFLGRLLPAFRHGKGHDIPYHIAYSFGVSAGDNMATGV